MGSQLGHKQDAAWREFFNRLWDLPKDQQDYNSIEHQTHNVARALRVHRDDEDFLFDVIRQHLSPFK